MPVIAIDGPAGSGKSTLARALATALGLDHLDTGAMYRAVTAAALRRGVDPADGPAAARVAAEVVVEMGDRIRVDGADVTASLREPEVSHAVSIVAAHPEVRAELVRRQREWVADRGGGVVEGRDIGTVVFADADLKIFLTADPSVRTDRRGEDPDIERRDRLDSIRSASPLTRAPDAVEIDTSRLSAGEVVAKVLALL